MDRDIYRQGQKLAYKYCENLNWRPSWNKHNYWPNKHKDGRTPEPDTTTHASPRRTPNNPDGVRPGQNIEDTERAPLEHLIFGDKEGPQAKRNGHRSTTRATSQSSHTDPSTDYVIDPITNRKVLKKPLENTYPSPDNEETQVPSLKSYTPQFTSFMAPDVEGTPIFHDGPPPEAELSKYGPFLSHEPDGKYAASYTEASDANSLSKPPVIGSQDAPHSSLLHALSSEHKDVRWHQNEPIAPASAASMLESWIHRSEPDSKLSDEQLSPTLEELGKYGPVKAHEPDGKYKLECESPVDPEELSKYGPLLSHEPDGKYAAIYIETPDKAELAAYRKPFLSHEPDGKYAVNHVEPTSDRGELAKYRTPFFSHEPDGKYAASYLEPELDMAELAQYKPFRSHEPDGKYAASSAPANAEPAEIEKYQAFRSNEPDGKYAAEADAARLAAKEAEDLANHEAFSYEDAEGQLLSRKSQESQDARELEAYRAVKLDEPHGSAESSSAYGHYNPAELQKYQAVRWNEPDGQPAETQTVNHSLTGNYVQDFPEDFSKSWVAETPEVISSLLSPEQKESEGTVQPALERLTQPKATAKASDTVTTPSPEPASPSEPALYKILVYNPTVQCIEIAETTSTVPDSAAPLTPAEVLLRISNPAKFFPHFAPLQAEGFEIVSGSGDVLIFRKVRDAVPEPQRASAPTAVNPIDMTGGRGEYTVAAGRFASPTGFVNYDLPPETTARSESEVPRQDSPWVEKKARADGAGKRSFPKKVIVGAAWLAGITYSVGVVSEYFKTGGSDGNGPKGF
ncbi:hypothetical protein C8A03DRAFT_32942 [Achaetomium macrosporum]|uniref:Uncharacterized protein n=1 Tax=Achaetomium macrosporum TaxID=79813 RepID=A0AAN7CBJ6_9PEZI|nr:hypothetical protein C8A03DRAFT_32942 [Achaetomium macrosporum]